MPLHTFRSAGWFLLLIIFLFLPGCAHKKAPEEKPLGPYLEDIYNIENNNPNADMFRAAMPSYIKQMDTLVKPSSEDKVVFKAAGAYFGYAFCFLEDTNKEEASALYLKGKDYALSELKRYRLFTQAYNKPLDDFKKGMAEGLDKRDLPAMYWTALNWVGWINLNLDNPDARAEIPKAQALLEYLNSVDDSYANGSAHTALGCLYANRPKSEGGDPDKAKEQFEQAFTVSGNSIFTIHVLYAKYYATQINDKELFKKTLEKVIQTPADYYPDKSFINEIARRKATILLENMDACFQPVEVKKKVPEGKPKDEATVKTKEVTTDNSQEQSPAKPTEQPAAGPEISVEKPADKPQE